MSEEKSKPNHPGMANLKPFGPGYDARRGKGRPGIVKDLRNYIRERLAEQADGKTEGGGATRLDAITSKLLQMAFSGNMKAMELCLAYGYGKPVQGLELTGKNGSPIPSHDFSKLDNDQLKERIAQLRKMEEEFVNGPEDGNDGTDTGQEHNGTPETP